MLNPAWVLGMWSTRSSAVPANPDDTVSVHSTDGGFVWYRLGTLETSHQFPQTGLFTSDKAALLDDLGKDNQSI